MRRRRRRRRSRRRRRRRGRGGTLVHVAIATEKYAGCIVRGN
jgi:hypothetical protein